MFLDLEEMAKTWLYLTAQPPSSSQGGGGGWGRQWWLVGG